MKLEELYTKTMSDEALKKAFFEAKKNGKLAEFLAENGCEANIEEAEGFLASKRNKAGELSDDELDSVAGGEKCGTSYGSAGSPIVTAFNSCEYYTDEDTRESRPNDGYCMNCYHSLYTDGYLVCRCAARTWN